MRIATRVAGVFLMLLGLMEIGDSLEIESRWRFLVLATGIVTIVAGFLVDTFTRHSRQVKMLRRVSMLCLVCGVMQAISRPFYPFLTEGTAFAGVTLAYIVAIGLMVWLHSNYENQELSEVAKRALDKKIDKRKIRKNLKNKYKDK